VGQIFALSAAPLLEKEESMINTYFIRALLFQVLVFFPIGLFLGWRWTAWAWMYFIDSSHHRRLWTFLAVLSYIPAMIAGFHIAYALTRAGKKAQTYWYLAGSAVGVCSFMFPLWSRLTHVQNLSVAASKIRLVPFWFQRGWFMLVMIIVGVYFFGGLTYVLRLNKADCSRVSREDFSRPMSA